MSPAASTARPDLASTLKRTSRSMPAMPIADSKRGDRRRDERDEQRREQRHRDVAAGIFGEARNGCNRDQEDDREPDEQDRQRDLVRRLLPLGAFDQRDHAVEEALARLLRDPHADPVGNDARARGHRRAVAAGLANDRRGFAGDRRFVDRGDALDHLAVGGDQVAGLDEHDLAGAKLRSRRRPRSCFP